MVPHALVYIKLIRCRPSMTLNSCCAISGKDIVSVAAICTAAADFSPSLPPSLPLSPSLPPFLPVDGAIQNATF